MASATPTRLLFLLVCSAQDVLKEQIRAHAKGQLDTNSSLADATRQVAEAKARLDNATRLLAFLRPQSDLDE